MTRRSLTIREIDAIELAEYELSRLGHVAAIAGGALRTAVVDCQTHGQSEIGMMLIWLGEKIEAQCTILSETMGGQLRERVEGK
ncbi:hypothetical protein J2D73_19545 [Acetobacter sacchari]|uniref:Uncharacterized protein n=1 Tax=Acetobacter sacchari TaxID=2661687 RepID=A0ABS3M198_9PROT|nr:hypothetical protein [Acetobacter sacchari]MBO1361980.1 hypothetical protein [Acetobacter sacchari]